MNQPEVALLDQVKKRDTAVGIVLGDVHHQPEIVLDHLLTLLESASLGETGDAQLFVFGEERVVTDVVEVQLSHIE